MRHSLSGILLMTSTCWCSAAPTYEIAQLGFNDIEHTRDDGRSFSSADDLNQAGHVRGQSQRYNGGSIDLGQSAWLYDGMLSRNIGLIDTEHSRGDDYKFSESQQLNEAGQIRGFSNRFDGGSVDLGRTAWIYDGSATVEVGFRDTEHTRDDGYKYSSADQLNDAGQARGYSLRFNGDSADMGRTAWLYDGMSIVDIGLIDLEHTRDDGYRFSSALDMNAAGEVRGSSQRFDGGGINLGSSAWIYTGSSTVAIGLVDAAHTRSDGYRLSFSEEMNQAGQVLGTSAQYIDGVSTFGTSTWLYDGDSTVRIGLTDSVHTRNDGLQSSFADELSESGNVFGRSSRYVDGVTNPGSDAWIYNGAETVHIGLFGNGFTRSNGYARTTAEEMNEAGQVRGSSERFDGDRFLGYGAWIYDGTTTIEIGLVDVEHTTSTGSGTGFRNSETDSLNAAGQVIGRSIRYDASDSAGQSAWLYNGTTTIKLGLIDGEHTAVNGERFSEPLELNDTGKVRGTSHRFANVGWGESAWLYNGATTLRIGLTDSEHTKDDGWQKSYTINMNDAGQVTGSSERFDGGSKYLGGSAWLYNGQTTVEIGLTGGEQTRNYGYQFNHADKLNELGQVLGYAERYLGESTGMGRDAWLYDPTLDQTFNLQLSTRSDGYAYSSATYLGEDGLVLGIYSLFDANDTGLGTRLFYFTVADGLHDLGSLIDGGLAANGWERLARIIRTNGRGQIIGNGTLASGNFSPFLLSPAVPEPDTLLVVVWTLPFVACRFFRRNTLLA